MISQPEDPKQGVAKIFNSWLAAPSIGTAWEVGILDELREKKRLNVDEYASKHNLDQAAIQGLVLALASVHVVERDEGSIIAGDLFEETYRAKGLFHWITLGSGNVFTRMQYNVKNEHRVGDYYQRDPNAISYACRDINAQYIDSTWWGALDGLDFKFSKVVDLGCGSGLRLMQMLERFPDANGLGVDIAAPTTKVATDESAQAGLADRLAFTAGDVLKLSYRDEFANVDLLTSFMMGHDFWPLESCVRTLRRLREAFPKVRRFLIGDATRFVMHGGDSNYDITDANIPLFSLGFEFKHALMDVKIPSMDDWNVAFASSGWRLVKRHVTDKYPPFWVIFELEHAETPGQ